ncbi:hypothetical protein BS78_10G155000 [Paspalum vaginatum]|nr:hypothetical protein BS78_10G155000 [Paspalum vaginatum]KAJ1259434.1 hypothetical protein BS78_10G155000 [Paspalum vaginatum]
MARQTMRTPRGAAGPMRQGDILALGHLILLNNQTNCPAFKRLYAPQRNLSALLLWMRLDASIQKRNGSQVHWILCCRGYTRRIAAWNTASVPHSQQRTEMIELVLLVHD